MNRVIVALSGGSMSACAASVALRTQGRENVSAITIDFHDMDSEVLSARRIADYFGIEHVVIDVDDIALTGFLYNLVKSVGKYAGLLYVVETQMMAGKAPQDTILYTGLTKDSVDQYQSSGILAFRELNDTTISCINLFEFLNKSEVIEKSFYEEYDVPFELTWDCYNTEASQPCLECDGCKHRDSIFESCDSGVQSRYCYSHNGFSSFNLTLNITDKDIQDFIDIVKQSLQYKTVATQYYDEYGNESDTVCKLPKVIGLTQGGQILASIIASEGVADLTTSLNDQPIVIFDLFDPVSLGLPKCLKKDQFIEQLFSMVSIDRGENYPKPYNSLYTYPENYTLDSIQFPWSI